MCVAGRLGDVEERFDDQTLQAALAQKTGQLELAAEHLRAASEAIGRIIGAVDVEDLLDYLFAEFCIGK